jgi:HEAT repeat protein
LQEEDQLTHTEAMKFLKKLGPAAKEGVSAITGVLLHGEYADFRAEAAKTLGQIGPAAKEAIPALKEAASSPRGAKYGGAYFKNLQLACYETTIKIGDANDALACVVAGIKSNSDIPAGLLREHPSLAELVIPAIADLLNDASGSVAGRVTRGLGEMGSSARMAVPLLKKARANALSDLNSGLKHRRMDMHFLIDEIDKALAKIEALDTPKADSRPPVEDRSVSPKPMGR